MPNLEKQDNVLVLVMPTSCPNTSLSPQMLARHAYLYKCSIDYFQYNLLELLGICISLFITSSPTRCKKLNLLEILIQITYRLPVGLLFGFSSPNFSWLNNVSTGEAENEYAPEYMI